MNAWPSLQTILLDGWIIRMADGFSKRANSVNMIHSFDNDLENKINYCENIFRKHGLPIIYKIVECDEHKIIDYKLETLFYEKIDVISVQISNDFTNYSIPKNIIIENDFSENWKKCLFECKKINDERIIKTKENMVKNIKHDKICVHKMNGKHTVGCGYGVIEKEYIGLFDINVKNEERGKGYGKEIVGAILSKAKDTGINKAHLFVENGNIVAKKLYEQFGFKELYKSWFRIKENG